MGVLGFLWLFVGLPGFGDCGPIKRGAGSTGPRGLICLHILRQSHESPPDAGLLGPRDVTPTWVPEACGEW